MNAIRNRIPERYDLIPTEALRRVALQFGSGTYPDTNFVAGLRDPEYLRECANHIEAHWQLAKAGDRSEDHLAKMVFGAFVLMAAGDACGPIDPAIRMIAPPAPPAPQKDNPTTRDGSRVKPVAPVGIDGMAAATRNDVKSPSAPPHAAEVPEAEESKKNTSARKLSDKAIAALELLKQGPLTTHEVGHHLYADSPKVPQHQNAINLLMTLRKRDLVERRECPQTRLDKWFIGSTAE